VISTLRRPMAREALLCAAVAASVAAVLAWAGPPGADLAAHVYQRTLFLRHGLALWNNFWYDGRYSFVTYSVLYYPLAALFGIKPLAVAAIGTASLAFALVVWREWGPAARWSSRTFAVVSAGLVLGAAFPFALGAALGLLAIWAAQARAHWRFALLAALTLAASPLAFLLLAIVLASVAIDRWADRASFARPALTVAVLAAAEVLLWRLFPDDGRYPFSLAELAAACVFCVFGCALVWRVERGRLLRWLFVVYAAACVAAFLLPSAIGENIARLRFAAVPVIVLVLSLRHWRPLWVCFVALALAIAWNVSPLVWNFNHGSSDPSAQASYWGPAIGYLRENLTPSYRVEVVDVVGHWEAVYLPREGIPLIRGWFRQSDFPQNRLLYDGPIGSSSYLEWLRDHGARYVVLTDAPPDYSAREEAELLRSGRSGLTPVFRTATTTVYAVPQARPLVTGPGQAQVLGMTPTRLWIRIDRPGTYRLAIRYSPYWDAGDACVARGPDSTTEVVAAQAGVIDLTFRFRAGAAIEALDGVDPVCR
jgi:hypothetical protein